MEFNENILYVFTSKNEYSALLKTLKLLGYTDTKREILVTLKIKKGNSLGSKLIQELKVQNSGKVSSKLNEQLGKGIFFC